MVPAQSRSAPVRHRGRWCALGLAAGVVALSWMLGPGAGTASAHAQLIESMPGAGATVRTPPARIVLEFDEPVAASSAQVAVTAPDGSPLETGEPRVEDATVSSDLQALSMAGEYTVGWRVVSADGHSVDGVFTFTATAGATAPGDEPAADTTAASESNDSWWSRHTTHIAAGVGVVALGLVLWWWERRQRG